MLDGWHVGEGVFAAIEGLCFLAWSGTLWLKKTHQLRHGWEKYEEFVMRWAFVVFWVSFLISTVFIAPFLQFRESEKEKKSATDELAKLTPIGSDRPYQTLVKEWTDIKSDLEKEKKARIKSDEAAERYRCQFAGKTSQGVAGENQPLLR